MRVTVRVRGLAGGRAGVPRVPGRARRVPGPGRPRAASACSGPGGALLELAADADLFLAEASFPAADRVARQVYAGELAVARGNLVVDLG